MPVDVATIQKMAGAVRERVKRVVMGQEKNLHRMLVALIAEGHVLLEGPPGTGKTLLARTFSACLKLQFKRIQFTPDLMPGDVLGTNLFNFQSNTFTLTKGPIFTEFLLADEINRSPPKTQSALLEAMQEKSVTIEGTSHKLSAGFMVVATQNPIEQEGTYPLPEAQLDRFLFKLIVPFPERASELEMIKVHGNRGAYASLEQMGITPVCDLTFIQAVRALVATLKLSDEMAAYVVDLVRATRSHPALQFGASPRSATMLAAASRAVAALEGRD